MTPKSVDLTEFFKYSKPRKRPCPIGFIKEQLLTDEVAQLEGALSQDAGIITAGAIQLWLSKRKHEASISAVTCHRKGVCSCVDV